MSKVLLITTCDLKHVADNIPLELGQEVIEEGARDEHGFTPLLIDLGDIGFATREQMIFFAREKDTIAGWWILDGGEVPQGPEQPEPIRDWAARTFACSKNVAIRPAYTGEAVR